MSFQTYAFELLQTRGEKGKALRRAMELWTATVAKFLEMAADRCDELEEIVAGPNPGNRLDHWVYDIVYHDPQLQQNVSMMEPTVKFAVYKSLHSQMPNAKSGSRPRSPLVSIATLIER